MEAPQISTARLLLRPLQQSDDAVLFSCVTSDREVMRYWDWPAHESIEITTAFVMAELREVANGRALYWAICLAPDGTLSGTCDLSEIDAHHRRAEVGFMLARKYWGGGYAFEAMQAVIDYAKTTLGIERLGARTHTGNDRSASLLKRLGFEFEGTLKRYILRDGLRRDCWMFGRMLSSD
jgi:[ribosomal protein S5]-alanine N-acetyltransferase